MQVAKYIANQPSLLNVAIEMMKHKSGQYVFLNDNNNENDTNKKHDNITCKTLNQVVKSNC